MSRSDEVLDQLATLPAIPLDMEPSTPEGRAIVVELLTGMLGKGGEEAVRAERLLYGLTARNERRDSAVIGSVTSAIEAGELL